MSQPLYKTIQGFVYAGPYDEVANGKAIRKIMVSIANELDENTGKEKVVRVTLWESHKDTPVTMGDFVAANGKWDAFESQNKETGEFVTAYSMSANKFFVLGNGLGGNGAPAEDNKTTTRAKREVSTKIDF